MKWQWWMEFLLRGFGRHCFILARDKNKKDRKKLRRKLVDHCPKQCETGSSQGANLETQKQTMWIEMHQSQVNMHFLRGPLRWMTEQKNPKFLTSLQNALGDTVNLVIQWLRLPASTVDLGRLFQSRTIQIGRGFHFAGLTYSLHGWLARVELHLVN